MMNLLKLAEKLASREGHATTITLTHGACLHERDAFAECHDCFSICPTTAITLGEPPGFDAEACAGCLACLPICPVGAYSGSDAVPDLLQCAAYLNRQHVEVLCAYGATRETAASGVDGAVAIEVSGCLAGLGTGAYLVLAAQGVERIDVRTEACAECPWEGLLCHVRNQVSQVRAWLTAWERTETVMLVPEASDDWVARPVYKASAPPISRRDLLRGLGRTDFVKDPLPVPGGNHPFRERLRLLTALQQWPMPVTGDDTDHKLPDGAGFSHLSIDDTCNACGTCTRACPVGALQLKTDNGHFRLDFVPQVCIGCDICAHLCPEQAIFIGHASRLNDVFGDADALQVHSGPCARCSRCRAPFVPADPGLQLCPLCDFRRRNPFGAQTPPGLLRRRTQSDTEQR